MSLAAMVVEKHTDVTDNTEAQSMKDSDLKRLPSLFSIFCQNRWRISAAYLLINLENAIALVQPLYLGRAIDGLTVGKSSGLFSLVGIHILHLAVAYARRTYDARTFNRVYSDVASQTVWWQRVQRTPVSQISARSILSRCYVDFYQQHLPILFQAVYCVGGALVVLWLYDPPLVWFCLLPLGPILLMGTRYFRRTNPLNKGLHDELEREVDVIHDGESLKISTHYRHVAQWRIQLADVEAVNFALTEFTLVSLTVVSIIRSCLALSLSAGEVMAIARYISMYTSGLDVIPFAIQQLSKLRDITRRLNCDSDPCIVEKPKVDAGNRPCTFDGNLESCELPTAIGVA